MTDAAPRTRRVPAGAIVFAGLLALFAVSALAETASRNPRLLPGLIALGAFAVPVGFVALMRDLLPGAGVPLRAVVTCFLCGGVIGTAAASVLEYDAVRDLGVLPALLVGALEEPAKLLLPLLAFAVGSHRRTADGLMLGVAAGMGFAAFETMGYALGALLGPGGDVARSEAVLLLRGALAPAMHPAWTGLVCAALWWARSRREHMPAALLAVPAAFLLAVLLHGAWDGVDAPAADAAVALSGVVLLLAWLFLARRELRAPGGQPARAASRSRSVAALRTAWSR